RSRLLFFYSYRPHPPLHSFPTRRSSDLPFLPEEIDPLIERGVIQIVQGVTSTSNIVGQKTYRCHRCHNDRDFTRFECVRCNGPRSEEHTSELQSRFDLVCRLLLEKKKRH